MHPVRSCSRDSPEGDPEGGGSPRAPVGPSAGGANAGRPAPPRDGGRLASERRAALRERFRGEHFKGRFRARVQFPLPGHVVLTHGCLRLEGYLHFKERVDVDVVLDLIHFAPEKGAVARAPVCPRAAAATAGGGSSITLEPFAVSVQRIADSPRAGLPLWGRRFLSGRPPPEGTAGGNAGRIAPAAPGEGPVLPPRRLPQAGLERGCAGLQRRGVVLVPGPRLARWGHVLPDCFLLPLPPLLLRTVPGPALRSPVPSRYFRGRSHDTRPALAIRRPARTLGGAAGRPGYRGRGRWRRGPGRRDGGGAPARLSAPRPPTPAPLCPLPRSSVCGAAGGGAGGRGRARHGAARSGGRSGKLLRN